MALARKSKRNPGDVKSTESAEAIFKRTVLPGGGTRKMKCPFCSYSAFTVPSLFKNHLGIHTGEKPFKCGVCDMGFSQLGNMKTHRVRCHSNQKHLKDHMTNKKFPQVIVKSVHTTTGENPTINEEDVRSSSNPTRPEKSANTELERDLKVDSANMNENHNISPQCYICFKTFCSLKELHTHLTDHTAEKPYVCPVCDCRFLEWEALQKHSIIHKDMEQNSKVSKEIDLQPIHKEKFGDETTKQLKFEGKFENKLTANAEPSKLRKQPAHKACVCNYCKTGFIQENALKLHLEIHLSKNRQWDCNRCPGTFLSHGELNSHHRLSHHRDKKSWLCLKCKKRFASAADLIRHLYLHTGEKPFRCNICNMRFTQKGSIKSHSRSHIGEKQTQVLCQSKAISIALETELHTVQRSKRQDNLDAPEKAHTGDNQTSTIFKPTTTIVDLENEPSAKEDIKYLQCDETSEQQIITNTDSIVSPKVSSKRTGGEKLFKCNTCNNGFSSKWNLQVHERLHTGKKPFKCNVCQVRFNQKSNLESHLRSHTGEKPKPFKCNNCKMRFSQKSSLKIHVRSHSWKKRFESNISNKEFFTKQKTHDHSSSHTGEKQTQLDFQPKVTNVKYHSQSDKGMEKKNESSVVQPMKMIDKTPSALSKSFICKYCKTGFIEPTTLKLHSKTHLGKKLWICNHCPFPKSFLQLTQFNSHLLISHRKEKRWICQECKKRFDSSVDLIRHLYIHTGEKPFKCNFCNKRCTQRSNLAIHLRVHTGEKPFKCSICDKAFTHKGSLRDHSRSHTGETPFKCNICGAGFKYRNSLKNHIIFHTREKRTRLNFQAQATSSSILDMDTQKPGEQLKSESDMENGNEMSCELGKQINSPSPPLEIRSTSNNNNTVKESSICKCCKTGFVKPSRSSHIHAGKNLWICNHCQQSFSKESALKYHYRQFHLGEKHCICEECKKRFKFMSELNDHLLEHTGGKPKNSVLAEMELNVEKSHEFDPVKQTSGTRSGDTTSTSLTLNPEERAQQWLCFLNVFNEKIAKQVLMQS